MDQEKINESFGAGEKGILTPRTMIIKKKYKPVKSSKYKQGCVLISKKDYDYLLKLANEAENIRFK